MAGLAGNIRGMASGLASSGMGLASGGLNLLQSAADGGKEVLRQQFEGKADLINIGDRIYGIVCIFFTLSRNRSPATDCCLK